MTFRLWRCFSSIVYMFHFFIYDELYKIIRLWFVLPGVYLFVCLFLCIRLFDPILDPEPRSGTVFVWSQRDEDPDFDVLSPSSKDAPVDSSTRISALLAKTQVDQTLY